jgi:AraC-like DNA-binding protein
MPLRDPQRRHAFFSPLATMIFEWLDVASTLFDPDFGWRGIHERPASNDLLIFELEHGAEAERLTYNKRCLDRAMGEKTTVTAQFAGMSDLFVPIVSRGHVDGVLVTGPFATARPRGADIIERWRVLTGAPGHPSDPEFSHYLSTTLSTLVLEGDQSTTFRKHLECTTRLMAGEGPSDEIYEHVRTFRSELSNVRLPERMWDAARAMVDERTSRTWASQNRAFQLHQLNVRGFPEQLLVGLLVNRDRSADPVDEIVRCDAFQRMCAERANLAGNVLSGRIGSQGVTLLSVTRGSPGRTRRYLLDFAEEISVLGRKRFGFNLHLGICMQPTSLPEQYRVAMAAAEAALSRGVRIVQASEQSSSNPLGPLRRELASLVDESPALLPTRFDRYLDAVAVRSRYRIDSARGHLEAGFDLIAETFAATGTLDPKSIGALVANVERAANEVSTLNELFAVYRKAVVDIVQAAAAPRAARSERSLQRAVDYMQKHQAETLSLQRVARVAGFATKYFSVAFRKKQGITFEHYLIKLRVERARQLLSRTVLDAPLSLESVARMSGFSSANYLCRTFKRSMGETPIAYRERVRQGLVGPRMIPRPEVKKRRARGGG